MSKIVIIGAGPCGLGAGFRLKELGVQDFEILEAADQPGGLAGSFTDNQGFTWDVGGHVQFSHYEDFDRVMQLALPDGWYHHQRESWVWIYDRFVPYPFQNNLWRLPTAIVEKCLAGLERLSGRPDRLPENFGEWIDQSFGEGIAEVFMRPYNFKVWAYAPEKMNFQWIGERVATINFEEIKAKVKSKQDSISWGPNSTFQFPKIGGTGAIWKSVAQMVGMDKVSLKSRVLKIDTAKKKILVEKNSSKQEIQYEHILSTIPLTKLCEISGRPVPLNFLSSNSHIVGIGLRGQAPEELKTKCWIYFPENNCPFYRVTVFSNYSPANVPDPKTTWSLMCETSSSLDKPVIEADVVESTIQGLLATTLIQSRDQIISRWSYVARPGYPTPFLNRDENVHRVLDEFSRSQIDSRGRFGLWKYEVSNQDHTFMQGFEWAQKLVCGSPEITAFHPNIANASGKRPLLT